MEEEARKLEKDLDGGDLELDQGQSVSSSIIDSLRIYLSLIHI